MGSRRRVLLSWCSSWRPLLTAAVLTAGIDGAAEAANVEGDVKTAGGGPAVGATVFLAKAGGFLPDMTVTDGTGHYKFDFVAGGCYELRAEDAGGGVVLYGDTILLDEQRRVTVSGANVTGADLKFLPVHTLSGTVTVAGASPPASELVTVLDLDGNVTALEKQFPHGAPGEYPYSFLVPSGDWIVRARNPFVLSFDTFYPGVFSVGDATPVTVDFVDVGPLGFTTPIDPALALSVRDSFDQPISATVEVFSDGSPGPVVQADTGLDGDVTVSVPLPPGSQVIVNAYPVFGLDPFGNPDGTNVGWSTPVTLTGGTQNLTLHTVTPPSIAGTVTEAGTGTPIDGGTVTLTPAVPVITPGAVSPLGGAIFFGNYQIASVQDGWYFVTATGPPLVSDFHVPTRTPGLVHIGSAISNFNLSMPVGGRFQVAGTISGGGVWNAFRIDTYDATTCKLVDSVTGPRTSNLAVGNYKIFVQPFGNNALTGAWVGGDACAPASPGFVGPRRPSASGITAGATTGVGAEFGVRTVSTVSGIAVEYSVSKFHAGGFLGFRDQQTDEEFSATPDDCGHYTLQLPNGSYDATLAVPGFATTDASVVVNGAPVVKDFTLSPGTLTVTGTVESTPGNVPVEGASVCARNADGAQADFCADTDVSGHFVLEGVLDDPAESVDAETEFNFEPKSRFGTLPTSLTFLIEILAPDPEESADAGGGPSLALNRPIRETANRATRRPRASLDRAFQSAEDVDWFRFDATSGKYYQATLSGTLASITLINRALYVGSTKAPVASGADALFGPGGWQAPSTGEFWVALSSSFSGSYSVSLSESDTPPVQTPTVTSISPTSGPAAGGTSVSIVGTDFASGATVSFGGTPAGSVVFVDSSHLTCTAPARPAGTLNDVVVTNPGPAAGTLTKGWLADFGDVPQAYIYHGAIEKVLRAAITSGCGSGNYCPDQLVTRDQMSVFILRGEHGGTYNPTPATGTVFSDVTVSTPFAKWMERFAAEGISTGCAGGSPPPYCPTQNVTRDAMAKFLLLGKHGSGFNPSAATGSVFADVHTNTLLAKWMEQLKAEGITAGCQAGVPLPSYCPSGTVTRGEMAKFVRLAFGL